MNNLNSLCVHVGFTFNFQDILSNQTLGMIRERHLARALREKVYSLSKDRQERHAVVIKIFQGKEMQSDPENFAAVENETRVALIKSGRAPFVPEDPDSFLPLELVREMILCAGGIPAYPLLADDA